jgi:hypothetical protein
MNRGTELVELLAGNMDFLSRGICKRPVEQTLSLYDLFIEWFSESFIAGGEDRPRDRVNRRHPQGIRAAGLSGHGRIGGSGYPDSLWARLDQIRIPKLDRIRVRLEGRLTRIHEAGSARRASLKTAGTAGLGKPRASKPVRVREPKEASGVVAKVSTTRAESLKKPPTTVVTTAAPPPPKPLKVIRRRKAEEPKVFETPPRSFPKAMLEGISSALEETGEHKGNE